MIFETLSQVSTLTELGGLRVAWEFLQKGGIFMVPLVLTSIAGMMAILYKALSLSNKRVIPATLVRELIQFQPRIITGSSEILTKELKKGSSTLARLATVVIKNRDKPRSEITYAAESGGIGGLGGRRFGQVGGCGGLFALFRLLRRRGFDLTFRRRIHRDGDIYGIWPLDQGLTQGWGGSRGILAGRRGIFAGGGIVREGGIRQRRGRSHLPCGPHLVRGGRG